MVNADHGLTWREKDLNMLSIIETTATKTTTDMITYIEANKIKIYRGW